MPTLVVLAAGMGSRYGGLKQIDPVGPSGETLLDYGVFDAIRAGFGQVVFVIRRDFEKVFREQVTAKYAGRIEVGFAFQSVGDLPAPFSAPAGREKPWGTAHALWCARHEVREDFAVINADDFYGADAFGKLAGSLAASGWPGAPKHWFWPGSAGKPRKPYCLVGFRLAGTLSEHGTVSRGICAVRGAHLVSIVEETAIRAEDVGPGLKFTGDETVSMNCWGFTPAVFPLLEAELGSFLRIRGQDLKAEIYLPAAISYLVAGRLADVNVLAAAGSWFGVTYKEDRPRVAAAIAELVKQGVYPAKLF
ncbi:MAG TPA: sugar phosphate nucleotidyltransferase [Opitutaceae bacterium]|jgi:hypothetical protein|nr:sugar phosphate nucleotidyltransferase [Opitutaceae bacterium]